MSFQKKKIKGKEIDKESTEAEKKRERWVLLDLVRWIKSNPMVKDCDPCSVILFGQ